MSGRCGRRRMVLVTAAVSLASCGLGPTQESSPLPLPSTIDQTNVGETVTLEMLFGADWQIAFVGSCALDLLAVGQQLIEIGFVPCLDPDDNRGSSVVLFEADGTLVRWYRTGLRVERLNGCFQPDQEVTLAPNGFNSVEPAARFSNSLTCLTVEER